MDTELLAPEAVEAAANQLRSQMNDPDMPEVLARKRARMILLAAQPHMADRFVPGQKTLALATMLLEQEAIPAARAAELEALAEILHDEVNSFERVRKEGVTPVHELNRFRRVLTERAAAIRAGGA